MKDLDFNKITMRAVQPITNDPDFARYLFFRIWKSEEEEILNGTKEREIKPYTLKELIK